MVVVARLLALHGDVMDAISIFVQHVLIDARHPSLVQQLQLK